MKKTHKIFSFILALSLIFGSGWLDAQKVSAAWAGQTAGIHDIFYPKDNSKLEKFKARILNGLLYLDPAIDVSDLDISPDEITYNTAMGEVTGEWAASYIVRNHPFYSTAATIGNPTFTYKDNGCVQTVSYTYHPAWNTDFVKKVIAGYDEAMGLIQPGDGDFAKILKFHDWIVKNVSYGLMGSYADFAVGALGNKKAVCAGYAKLYQFFLDQSGIENIYIAAKTQKEPHAWNLVRYEGHWFHVDCTWDRGITGANVNHWYFMMSDEEFNANGKHTDDWKSPDKNYPTGNVCTIENKFYENNTDIATSDQIHNNPVKIAHVYHNTNYTITKDGHSRTCAAGVMVKEAHTGDICQICGYDKTKDPDNPDNPGNPDNPDISDSGHGTIFGIFETDKHPQQISFEVPLYVVVAAVEGSSQVLAPASGSYCIANTTGANSNIGVLGMFIEKVPGATWNTVEGTPATSREIRLSIGDYVMPALSADLEKKTVAIYDDQKDTKFTKKEKQQDQIVYQAISSGEKIVLDIAGTVTNEASRTNNAAAAQFKVTYFVSALDENNLPLGNVYVGNNPLCMYPAGSF